MAIVPPTVGDDAIRPKNMEENTMFSNKHDEKTIDLDHLQEISNEIIYDKKRLFSFYDKLRKKTTHSTPNLDKPESSNLWDLVFLLPDFFILFIRLMADKRVPKDRKVFLSIAIGYIVLPLDFIPDIVPILGHIDDFIFAVITLDILLADIDKNIITELWPGKHNVIDTVTLALEKIESSLYSPLLKVVKAILHVTRKSE